MNSKFIVGLFLFSITLSTNAQKDLFQLNTSLQTNHFYDAGIDEEIIVDSVRNNLDYKAFETFNNTYKLPNGFLVNERIRLGWDGTSWQNGFRETFVYNIRNKIVEYLLQNWQVSEWMNNDRELYIYDEN